MFIFIHSKFFGILHLDLSMAVASFSFLPMRKTDLFLSPMLFLIILKKERRITFEDG